MEPVLLVIHLILALGIIGLVLLQRSEGGGLGIGGGGGMGGLATPKGTANLLTRMTAIFAGLFFCTSLALGILAGSHHESRERLLSTITAEESVPQTEEIAPSEEESSSEPEAPAVPIAE